MVGHGRSLSGVRLRVATFLVGAEGGGRTGMVTVVNAATQ